jgi:TnpA family transposase
VNNPFYNQIPEINVTDLFDWVDNHCDFMKEFTHLTTNIASEKNNPSIKACITANATGMGINKMSNNCDLSYSSLIHTQQNNIRLETLIAANDRVINKIGELSIFKYHDIGGFQHGSVDGQKSTVRRDTFMSRYSTKYFGLDKGVVSLNMVFNDVPVTARIIGANEYEGHHLSSMLHNNTSELKLNRLSTDTHGSNNLNFLLLDLWDIEFIPCYKNIRKKSAQICGFKNPTHYKDCIIKPAYKINKQSLIKEEDNIQQIFAAIMMKETPQHVIVKKICSYEGKNKTKAALWAYNDILMSIHILKYIDTLELRQFARAALNRGEGYHQLNANIRSMNGKCFRGSLDSGIAIENECVRLMANNFVYYNGYILSEVMTRKENENNHEGAEFIRKLSLTASQHFNFSGRFEFKNERQSIDTDIGEVINHLDKLLDKLQADNLMYRQTKTNSSQES